MRRIWFWLLGWRRGVPGCNGWDYRYLVQYEDSKVGVARWWPNRDGSGNWHGDFQRVVYWRRLRGPIPRTTEVVSYSPRLQRSGQGWKAAVALLLLCGLANAAPPPGADPALEPFFQGLQRPDNGGSCCGQFQDCREVDSRAPAVSPSHHWEALIDDKAFPNQSHVPNEWVVIPDWMVNDAPTTLPRPPRAIACFLGSITVYSGKAMLPAGGHLICFKTPIPWT